MNTTLNFQYYSSDHDFSNTPTWDQLWRLLIELRADPVGDGHGEEPDIIKALAS